MHKESDDFSELRKLLTIKRHEAPPPGYFHRFSDKVIARIETQQSFDATPGWRRWLAQLLNRPATSGAFAMLLGAVAVGSLGLMQNQVANQSLPSAAAWAAPAAIEPLVLRDAAVQPVAPAAILPSSVSPVAGPVDSPFRYHGLRAERVAFQTR
jgi:hypothetical protein